MDREEASRALDLLTKVVAQARDESSLQNWGAIWIFNGLTNAGGFVVTQVLFWHDCPPLHFAILWASILSVNLTAIFFLKRNQTAGARTFIENQIWSIWTAFIVASVVVAFVNLLIGLDRIFVAPVMCVLAGVAFAQMGAVMGRRWYGMSAVFVAAALGTAAVPQWQFVVLGGLWCFVQSGAGVRLLVERRRRLAAHGVEPHLV